MVSLPYLSNLSMYPQKPYTGPAPAWYSNYSHHTSHHANNQFLNGAPTPIGAGPNGLLESDAQHAASFYNHHLMATSSPDWSHDNYNLQPTNSQFFPNGMTPPTSLHLSPTINNASANTSADNLQNGLQNIPPSPPITVNSACSEMSSPGIASSANAVVGNGDTSPNLASNSLSRSKSPYEWMKKPSYQSQLNTGKECFLNRLISNK